MMGNPTYGILGDDVPDEYYLSSGETPPIILEPDGVETTILVDVISPPSLISYRQHMMDVSKLTYPIILSEIFQNCLPVVDVVFVGQLGKNELACAALATVWFNVWHSAMIGFLTATDTFLSQSYGANQMDTYAIWTGNSLIITVLTTIFVSGAMTLCTPCMKLFGQDPDLADAAGEFSYRLIPGLLPLYLFKVLTKYLQTQNILGPGIWIGVLANAINAVFNWGLIYAAGWGLVGAPWATSLTRLAQFLIILLYMVMNKRSLNDSWPVFNGRNMKYSVLKPFWKLAISGALSFSAKAWSFEITSLLAGLFGTVTLDAHTITFSISCFFYLSFPYAVGIAASIRVGQLVGEQKPRDAQRSSHASFFISIIIQLTLVAVILPCSDLLGNLFTSDELVARLASQLMPIVFVFMMGDAIQSCAGGVLRGLGRQNLVLLLNILAFWILAVPIGSIFAFIAGMGVFGLWWGMTIGIYVAGAIGVCYLRRVDWEFEARKALKGLSSTVSTLHSTDSSSPLLVESCDEGTLENPNHTIPSIA